MNTSRFDTLLTSLRTVSDNLSKTLPFKKISGFIEEIQQTKPAWPPLRIGRLVAPVPIVQGGMGVGISLSSLASAVAEAGGIGVIAANGIGLLEKDYFEDGQAAGLRAFRREIRTAREKTKGIIGVNIMVALNDFHQMLDVAIEEKVDIVFMGAGLPIKGLPVARMRENGVAVAPIVSSARAAEMIFKMWGKIYQDIPDAVVFEGPLAGGHLGFAPEQLDKEEFQLKAIVPQIVEALIPFSKEFGREIPVIAGGGVYSGQDVYDTLQLGASGVQMATRFVATDECDADIKFKQAYVDCTEDQIGLIKSPVGMPGRAIRNDFILAAEEGRRPSFRCAWKCLASCKAQDANYCISIALNNARKGLLRQGFVFVGANAYKIDSIVPVASLVNELAEGYWLAAHEKASVKLEQLVERAEKLWKKYEGMDSLVIELGKAYEQALHALPEISLTELRNQYNSAISKARNLQLQTVEHVVGAWDLFKASPATVPQTSK
ncbi:2-nitropropane dioxygenase-like enzyme [Sphaerochaeta pleomorpha str. Grapes]|uniref:2-nitropropane dioxygenase-like enzyme n=1 Tax=Sphaerochaeta pleomorpha (strain ATCC BAA-1885 / DSM 22778 / Grapes) TaxID=158190 RepID=G8QUI7_SPHPG|nr:nitronate monooxygenase [Sphaerochaeta pleomorpha]AEV29220.1 2-nitropropane dioxygenase-like enzyme [Sphaerochaeta pleomorpha str. Grapes]